LQQEYGDNRTEEQESTNQTISGVYEQLTQKITKSKSKSLD